MNTINSFIIKAGCALLAALLTFTSAQAENLPASVIDALRKARIPLGSVGIVVREIHAPTPLIQVNAKQSMNPASTMKLLTTYAALEMLGPAYTWKTEAYADGQLENGILRGNLIIKGYGNPKINSEHLWLWLRELRNRGLREIHGDLILDRSVFATQEADPAAFDNDPGRAYNVVPDALLLNFNAIRLRFVPANGTVNVFTEPSLAGITIDNRLTLKKQNFCANWDGNIGVQLVGDAILLQGTYPSACGERDKPVNLLSHARYFDAVFRSLWQEMGGTVRGATRDGITPASAMLLATHYSQPLSEIIRDINKFSNNVMARQLLLSLSLNKEIPLINTPAGSMQADLLLPGISATPASVERSEIVLRNWIAQKGFDFPELVLENGAGLSRKERLSPYNLSLLLQDIQLSPFSAEIEASLPIVGVDGTMKKRHDNCAVTAHAHLKTGSLEGVKSIAGYLQSRSGKQWILVFLVNHPNASMGQQAQDELIEWLEQQ
ncbi:MAG: D-alanyl-D-alanine carboxypeptidase/D-alanyl-D-alanine-endopeptidase [Gallionellaceae bacterium]|jgi:D-alanyl-D-alanine carboxypeptidase/D-alanyl-D-alanine-endopeptidase (penicillin-binding protein 4)